MHYQAGLNRNNPLHDVLKLGLPVVLEVFNSVSKPHHKLLDQFDCWLLVKYRGQCDPGQSLHHLEPDLQGQLLVVRDELEKLEVKDIE